MKASKSDLLNVKSRHWYSYLLLCFGCFEFLSSCLWGLVGATPLIFHWKQFLGAHIQFAANAAMLCGCAYAFTYIKLPMKLHSLTAILLILGAWLNPLAYCYASITGYASPMNTHSKGLITDENNFYSLIQHYMLLTTAFTDILGLLLLLVGLFRARKEMWGNHKEDKNID